MKIELKETGVDASMADTPDSVVVGVLIYRSYTLLRRAFVLWKLMRYFQNISQIIIKL